MTSSTAVHAGLLHTDDDLTFLVSLDGVLLCASSTLAAAVGEPGGDLTGRHLLTLVGPDDVAALRGAWAQLCREGRLRTTLRLHGARGVLMWLDVSAKVLNPDSGAAVVYTSARDVTDDVLSTQHLAASEQQWRLAFEHSPIGGALLDASGEILLANDALSRMLAYPVEDLVRLRWSSLVHPEDLERGRARWAELVSGGRDTYTADSRYIAADGRTLWGTVTAAAVPDAERRARRVMVQLLDITEQREADLQLANRALHDPLTGLPNRFLTRQWLASAIDEHTGEGVGVLYCDLDRFKLVNDSLGHSAGDDLLAEAAARIREVVAPDDLLGRVGGDEFVVVCEGAGGEDALMAVAARIAAVLDEPIRLRGHQHTVTISIGAAVGRSPDTADEVLMRADMALLRAKRFGRARVEVFDAAVDRIATEADLELEDDLRGSVDSDELRAYYQPIVTLDGRRTVGHESLVRWQHPYRGLLPPAGFLDLAETSGLIGPIGWWMLGQVCKDAAASPARLAPAGGWVAVNASPSQLARPGVFDRVSAALACSGLPPERLHLEITETALIHASSSLVGELGKLGKLGVRVVLDDFGTGYSSLSLLRDLPVDMVKIDRSFVAPLATDRSALAIVRAVLSMCHDLGLPTVAEGVENEQQVRMLTDLGCSHAQGYLFGRPFPLARLTPCGAGTGARTSMAGTSMAGTSMAGTTMIGRSAG